MQVSQKQFQSLSERHLYPFERREYFSKHRTIQHTLGFTLIELLIAISVLSILTFAAAPSFGRWQAKSESQTVVAELYRYLQTARQYAITLNQTVSFCGADAQGKCKRNAFDHLLIFIDENENKRWEINEELIAKHKISLAGKISLNAHTAIKYKYDGRTATPASFIYCPKLNAPGLIQRVTISMTGRAYVAPPAADGIVTSASGGKINC